MQDFSGHWQDAARCYSPRWLLWTVWRIFAVIRMSEDGGRVEAYYREWVRKTLHQFLVVNIGFSWTLAICQDGIQTVRQINLDMNSTKGRDCISITYRWKFLVTHGGVEMGDGSHTNMYRLRFTSFSGPFSSLRISGTSTDKHLYGQAVWNACEEIKSRMRTVAEKGTFSSIAK